MRYSGRRAVAAKVTVKVMTQVAVQVTSDALAHAWLHVLAAPAGRQLLSPIGGTWNESGLR
jgi:hypothetical protein